MEIIQSLRDEIAILKGDKPKPKIKPSGMEKGDKKDSDKKPSAGKRPGSEKRKKTEELKIHKPVSSHHKTRSVFDRYHITNEDDLKKASRKVSEYYQDKASSIHGHNFGHNQSKLDFFPKEGSPFIQ